MYISTFDLIAQSKRVEIINADYFEIETRDVGRVKKLLGNVVLRQDATLLKCDSAYLFDETDFVEAYRNVNILHNDSISFKGDELKYDSRARRAKLLRNVIMKDPTSVLYTDELEFNFNTNLASYLSKGRLLSSNSELTSVKGYYNISSKEILFVDKVVLTNPEFILYSDSLNYNTTTKVATFIGRSSIISQQDTIYCSSGTYHTEKQSGILTKQVKLRSKETTVTADTIYYNRKNQYSKGVGHLVISDTINKLTIKGDIGETYGLQGKSYVTKHALVFQITDSDTMFISADSIWVFRKTKLNMSEKILAYTNVKFYRNDMQAICDSMSYQKTESVLNMFKNPILWSDENQVSGDTIKFLITNRKIDSVYVYGNAFVISKENKKHYNQIKGRFLEANFKSQKINLIHVLGNSQSIYYAKEDSAYIGVNVVDCSEMSFSFEQGKIKSARFDNKPDAFFYPIGQLTQDELKLRGFKWRATQRPRRHYFK